MQPNAAATLARDPLVSAAASVYSTPVPGEATTISEVSKNDSVIGDIRSVQSSRAFRKASTRNTASARASSSVAITGIGPSPVR